MPALGNQPVSQPFYGNSAYRCEICGVAASEQTPIYPLSGRNERFRGRCSRHMPAPPKTPDVNTMIEQNQRNAIPRRNR